MSRRDPEDFRAWWASLAGGLVVLVAVWVLLEWLRRTVEHVDERVAAVWTMGKRVARNTQAAHLLETTKERGVELAAEIEAHAELRGAPKP